LIFSFYGCVRLIVYSPNWKVRAAIISLARKQAGPSLLLQARIERMQDDEILKMQDDEIPKAQDKNLSNRPRGARAT
jgi:hypothetical protein